ncbi:MAG: HEPN domain-containing protein, partial [Anaerolineales bacterium]|nr:HEPN domain-containing protein [Anaerolineales bacterium]
MKGPNAELIDLHVKAAHESLDAGQYTLDGGFPGVAVTRAYYACFYAASALLLTRDITRSKHSGVLSAFRQHFVKSRMIESEYSDIYGAAFEARHIADVTIQGSDQ